MLYCNFNCILFLFRQNPCLFCPFFLSNLFWNFANVFRVINDFWKYAHLIPPISKIHQNYDFTPYLYYSMKSTVFPTLYPYQYIYWRLIWARYYWRDFFFVGSKNFNLHFWNHNLYESFREFIHFVAFYINYKWNKIKFI